VGLKYGKMRWRPGLRPDPKEKAARQEFIDLQLLFWTGTFLTFKVGGPPPPLVVPRRCHATFEANLAFGNLNCEVCI